MDDLYVRQCQLKVRNINPIVHHDQLSEFRQSFQIRQPVISDPGVREVKPSKVGQFFQMCQPHERDSSEREVQSFEIGQFF